MWAVKESEGPGEVLEGWGREDLVTDVDVKRQAVWPGRRDLRRSLREAESSEIGVARRDADLTLEVSAGEPYLNQVAFREGRRRREDQNPGNDSCDEGASDNP